MASVLESDLAEEIENQTAFNLAVWEQVLADPSLERLPYRIETDRHGLLVMSPPPAPEHGEEQSDIVVLLAHLLPQGRVITECPISTQEGVKLADVVWISKDRRQEQRGQVCLSHAPEICVEIFSPKNTRRGLREKRALYFEAGAEEVWFCYRDGRMEFFLKGAPETPAGSAICPAFPTQLEIDR